MGFKINVVVSALTLSVFTLPNVTYVAQAASEGQKPSDLCIKRGKALPAVKTKEICSKEGGSWVKSGATHMPVDPFEKHKATKLPDDPSNKSTAMPPDPLGKNKAIKMPDDPFGKSKAIPREGQNLR